MRRGKVKYLCKTCNKWFQINRTVTKSIDTSLALLHIQGVSFRSLAQTFDMSVGSAYSKVSRVLATLPHCADISRQYCSRYGGILLVDGKYVAVKGYDSKIPVLYGVDYDTHDIPTYRLSVAENYQTCLVFFQSLRLLNYPLQALVCDDNRNIYQACLKIYPKTIVQLCQNHYKESIRKTFHVRTDNTHISFVHAIEHLFKVKRSQTEFNHHMQSIMARYGETEEYMSVILDIYKRFDMICGYMNIRSVPRTTNLIESMNSHLQGRLKTIKGFESMHDANHWLNAYFLYRIMNKFTDCEGKFKRLNGFSSLQKTITNISCYDDILPFFR